MWREPGFKSMYEDIKEYKVPRPKKFVLITGEERACDDQEVIAFCYSDAHKGFLTAENIARHRCFYKYCPCLHKLPEREWWNKRQPLYMKQRGESFTRQAIQERKQREITQAELAEQKCVVLKEFADNWVREHSFEDVFRATSVKSFQPSLKRFVLFYVSDQDSNDAHRWLELARAMGKEFGVYIKLVHAKDASGRYAMLSQLVGCREGMLSMNR